MNIKLKLYKLRRQILKMMQQYMSYIFLLFRNLFISDSKDIIYIDVQSIELNRYLFNFIKSFIDCGYTVYIPNNRDIIFKLLRRKAEFQYAHKILKSQVKLGYPKGESFLKISKELLSNDYYSMSAINDQANYRVPIGPHPDYNYNKPRETNESTSRISSIFMIGNISKEHYQKLDNNPHFKIISRYKVSENLKSHPNYYSVNHEFELRDYISSGKNKNIIIIDTSQGFNLPRENYSKILSLFEFYIALPGIEVPESHNLFESMSRGCIPIMHKTYAELFYPKLENIVNCLTYESLDELNTTINIAFNMDEQLILEMRQNIYNYFDKNLSPEAIVSNIKSRNYNKIYLQAELLSLSLL